MKIKEVNKDAIMKALSDAVIAADGKDIGIVLKSYEGKMDGEVYREDLAEALDSHFNQTSIGVCCKETYKIEHSIL
jgi:hypothetical protein